MKRKSILGIVLLMSLSLLGIIVAQFLWIKQSIKVQREKFHVSAFEALDNTVRRLEREHNANLIFNSFFAPRQAISSNDIKFDSLRFSISSKQYDQNGKPYSFKKDTIIDANGTRIQTHVEIGPGRTEHQVRISAGGPQMNVSDLEEKLMSIEDSINQIFDAQHSENNALLEVFNQMQYEMKNRFNPLQNRLDLSKINDVLNEELAHTGINTKFEYGIFDQRVRQLSKYHSNDFDIEKAKSSSPLSINLFHQDIFRGISPYNLVVYFPDIESYLYRTQGWLLSLSSIFTLFILITFFLTIRMILNQKKVSQIKTDFINNMTHEFKTPIATINLATDSILTPSILGNPDQMKNFLRIIKEENNRMNSHVERVLQMSQIEKRDFSIIKSPHDIHELILLAIDSMQLLVNETGGNINHDLNAEITNFDVDEVHFGNLLVNLLENALKYSQNTPEVTVATKNQDNGIWIQIADKGIGMTKEQQSKIFDKFYRARGGNVHDIKGFGLGLSYVKAVIDAHGGTINVKSKVNQGTEFSIYLPYNR